MTDEKQPTQPEKDLDEDLSLSNAYAGRIGPDAEAICHALYALAREVRHVGVTLDASREESRERNSQLDSIRDHVHTAAVALEALEGRS